MFLVVVEALVHPLGCEALYAREALGPADRLNVLVDDLIG